MAGRPRKPTTLHVIDGTLNATRHADRSDEPQPTGKPVRPKFLKGRARKLWDYYFPILYWLTEADSHMFALFCGLTAEMESDLKNMNSSRITQLRSLGAELGVLPGPRSRINVGNALKNNKKEQDPAEKFFVNRSS